MIALLAKIIQYRYVIILGLFFSLCVAFYLHYLKSTLVISELRTKNTELERIVTAQSEAIANLRADYNFIIKSRDEMAKEVVKAQQEQDELRQILFRENFGKRSLEKLATQKTSLIEKKINAATKAVFVCLEKISRGEVC